MTVCNVGLRLSLAKSKGQVKSKRYTQKYRKNWEKKSCFQGWLQGKQDKAFCKVCCKDLQSKLSVLKAHGKSSLHITKMKALKDPLI